MRSISTILFLLICGNAQAGVILFEDFEDAAIHYLGPTDSLGQIADRDYYGRVGLASYTGADPYVLSNIQGSMFYAVEDMDSAANPIPNNSPLNLDFSINIANFDNLMFSIFVAEDDSSDGFEDWDASDEFKVTYQIDGGGFQDLFWIQGTGSSTNQAPSEDTNFDGQGDGTVITDSFQQFSKSILGTGSILDLRITWVSTNFSGDEDLAIDNVMISGAFNGVPEPATCCMFAGVLALGVVGRRRIVIR
jgi:hypothetical protein